MRFEPEITKNPQHFPNVFKDTNRESEAIDRKNARRFKQLVTRPDHGDSSRQKLGLPFAIERPEAAAAHRELEQELKPAAQIRNSEFRFSGRGSFNDISRRVFEADY